MPEKEWIVVPPNTPPKKEWIPEEVPLGDTPMDRYLKKKRAAAAAAGTAAPANPTDLPGQAEAAPGGFLPDTGSYMTGVGEGIDIPTQLMRGAVQLGAMGMDQFFPRKGKTYSQKLAEMLAIGDNIAHPNETQRQEQFRGGGELAGNIIGTLPLAAEMAILKTPTAIAALPKTAPFGAKAAQVAQNTIKATPAAIVNRAPGGMIAGAAMPSDSGSDVLNNMALGGALNVAAEPVLKAVGYVANKPLQFGSYLLKEAFGANTGVGQKAITEAIEAGKEGKSLGQAFLDNMRSENVSPETVVRSANLAVANLRGLRQKAYKDARKTASGTGWADIQGKLSFKPIDALMDARKFTGLSDNGREIISEDAAKTYKIIKGIVDDWKKKIPKDINYRLSAEGFDDLKKKISDVARNGELRAIAGPGTQGEGVVSSITTELGNIIKAKAPGYAAAMESYEAATNVLNQMEDAFRLTGRKDINYDKSLRALQKILRDNANTNYAVLGDAAEQLKNAGAPNLMAELAGQSFRGSGPRGIAGAGGPIPRFAGAFAAGSGLGANIPAGLLAGTVAGLSSSPRIVGEGAYAIGTGMRLLDPAVKRSRELASILARQIPPRATQNKE